MPLGADLVTWTGETTTEANSSHTQRVPETVGSKRKFATSIKISREAGDQLWMYWDEALLCHVLRRQTFIYLLDVRCRSQTLMPGNGSSKSNWTSGSGRAKQLYIPNIHMHKISTQHGAFTVRLVHLLAQPCDWTAQNRKHQSPRPIHFNQKSTNTK